MRSTTRAQCFDGRAAMGVVLAAVAITTATGCRTGSAPAKAPQTTGSADEAASEASAGGYAGDPKLPGITRVDAKLTTRLAKALADMGADYKPRTHHLEEDGSPKFTNRLIEEGSPYLLQHAHNPVNFFPWGQEAFDKAIAEDKPILLSIGYSTCHWCHVMERESFEDEEIAGYMNAHYVSIKVDREERPDLDSIYMTAVNMLVGRGGWPMTVILTPKREPFFGGTYFPPRDGMRGRKGFLTILQEMKQRYATDKDAVVAEAAKLSRRIAESSRPRRPGNVAGEDALRRTAHTLASRFDPNLGGFGRAPKFPQPARISLLLRYHRRTGDAGALRMATETLDAMSAGGMYDHVGGGFHRYSTDARWLVPHFEKMLYDNAQLAAVYLDAYQVTGRWDHKRVVTETLDYVAREMTDKLGGFYSATDADSTGPSGHMEEGYYFTWTPAELEETLGEKGAALVTAYYGITRRGNFEHRNILNTPRPRKEVAKELGLSLDAFNGSLEELREKLWQKRSQRIAPGLDDKILTAWNGLMISAFARAGWVLDRKDYADRAVRAVDFLLDKLRKKDGRLLRSYRNGRSRYNGYLDDHAFLIAALLDVYEATGQLKYLREAIAIQKVQDEHFFDDGTGGYFATSDDHEKLLTRDKPTYDGAVPSGNSVAVMNLLRLSEFTTDVTYRARAEATLGAFAFELGRGGMGSTRMLAGLDYYHDLPKEIVIVTADGGDDGAALTQAARSVYVPNRLLTRLTDSRVESTSELIPLVQGKLAIGGKPTAFVCEQGRCELPTSDPKVLAKQLRKTHLIQPQGVPLNVPGKF